MRRYASKLKVVSMIILFIKRISSFTWVVIGVLATIIGLALDIPSMYEKFESKGSLRVSIWGAPSSNTEDATSDLIVTPFLISKQKIQFVHIPIPMDQKELLSICSQMHFVVTTEDSKTLKNARITFKIIRQKDDESLVYKTKYGEYLNTPEIGCSFDDNIRVGKTFSGKEELTRSLTHRKNGKYNSNNITYFFSDIFPKKYGVVNFFQQALPGVMFLTENNGESVFNYNETVSNPPDKFYLNFRPVYVSVIKTLDDGAEVELGTFLIFYHFAKTRADLYVNARIISENYAHRYFTSIGDIWNKDYIEHVFLTGNALQIDYQGINKIATRNDNDSSKLISELKKSGVNNITMLPNSNVALHCEKIGFIKGLQNYFSDKFGDFSNLDVHIDSKEYIVERNQLRSEMALMNTLPSMFEEKSIKDLLINKYQNDCSYEEVNIKVHKMQ